MKKIIVTIITIFSMFNIASAYYTAENFIDFLVHSNQLRVRTDRLGVLVGNENYRSAVGLTGADIASGYIWHNADNVQQTNAVNSFIPSVLAGFGYDGGSFGVGAGYEFTYKNDAYMVHTPVLTATALDDNLRINIPVSIGVGSKSKAEVTDLTGSKVISTAIEARYYFPQETPAVSHIRLYGKYGNAYIENVKDKAQNIKQESFGLQARVYFKIETENVLIEPILRLQYDQALKTEVKLASVDPTKILDNFDISAKGFTPYWPQVGPGSTAGAHGNPDTGAGIQGGYIASIPGGFYAIEPYRVGVAVPVGFTAKSQDENIVLYLEPAVSFTMISAKHMYTSTAMTDERTTPFMGIGYVVYGELYIRPVKDLEWYTEIQTGGVSIADSLKSFGNTSLVFNASTGITYYF